MSRRHECRGRGSKQRASSPLAALLFAPPLLAPLPPPSFADGSAHSAAPSAEPRPPPPSTVELARLAAGALYARGDKQPGPGTRQLYHVLSAQFELDVARFPHPRFGFEIDVRGGPIGVDERAEAEIGFSVAGLAAPFRWDGAYPGSVVLGLGPAFEMGRPVWLDPGFHGALFGLLRFRIFPAKTIGLQLTYRYVPLTTEEVWVQEHDVDLSVSTGLLQLGLRARMDDVLMGSPERPYRTFGGGLFVGLIVY